MGNENKKVNWVLWGALGCGLLGMCCLMSAGAGVVGYLMLESGGGAGQGGGPGGGGELAVLEAPGVSEPVVVEESAQEQRRVLEKIIGEQKARASFWGEKELGLSQEEKNALKGLKLTGATRREGVVLRVLTKAPVSDEELEASDEAVVGEVGDAYGSLIGLNHLMHGRLEEAGEAFTAYAVLNPSGRNKADAGVAILWLQDLAGEEDLVRAEGFVDGAISAWERSGAQRGASGKAENWIALASTARGLIKGTESQVYGDIGSVAAIKEFELAKGMWNELGNQEGVAWCYWQIGILRAEDTKTGLEPTKISFEKAMKIWTIKEHPTKWARMQVELAEVYMSTEEMSAEQADGEAHKHLQGALGVLTRKNDPDTFALANRSLGEVLLRLPEGKTDEGFEKAMDAFAKAQMIMTKSRTPRRWAGIQEQMARGWAFRSTGEKTENLKRALSMLEEALPVWQGESPFRWVNCQNEMGKVLMQMPEDEKGVSYQRACAAFRKVLEYQLRNGEARADAVGLARTRMRLAQAVSMLSNMPDQPQREQLLESRALLLAAQPVVEKEAELAGERELLKKWLVEIHAGLKELDAEAVGGVGRK